MATKDELTTQAIEKAQKLEVGLTGAQKDIETLQSNVTELRSSDRELRDLLQSLRTLRWIFRFCLLPLLVLLMSAAGGAIYWSARLSQRVETMDQQVQKIGDRLESTRDRIITRQEEFEGRFVKIDANRIYMKTKDMVKDYWLAPDVTVFLKGERAALVDLKEGMPLHLHLGRSINDKYVVLAIDDEIRHDPDLRVLPKKSE